MRAAQHTQLLCQSWTTGKSEKRRDFLLAARLCGWTHRLTPAAMVGQDAVISQVAAVTRLHVQRIALLRRAE